ncbi:PorP/SprF family type IX secretion system membrane protein [Marinifilum sp. D737]|uniref:PorP/SprF family type IX secretion system membrane protein n=1 Tax=Marinifilum sp. D737 TaxID=2969628 RepID=UPI002272AA65|nr:type IX secretion system membrane protein PorP/SprF [Marinifilum sp. D737]MCY1636633.1 type IX secretion system membrane protein PorP/SprF [Marinifilum sp. D737]
MKSNYIKIIVLFLLMEFSANGIFAQQDAMYTQYMFNIQAINPAYAGSKDALSATLISRNQWVGFEGAPNTTSFSVHTPLLGKLLGLGFSYVHDEIGPTKISFINVDLSARIKVNSNGYLAAGIKSGIDNQEIKLSMLTPSQREEIYDKNYSSNFEPNFGVGLFYYTDRFYLGLSSPRVMRRDFISREGSMNHINETERHFYFNGGYVMDINRNLKFKPSYMLKYVAGAPLSFDLTAAVMLKEKVVAGVAVREGDSFGAVLQLRIAQQFWFGYAYDFTTSRLRNYNSGIHEVMVSFDLGLYKNGIVKSPRFF